MFDLGCSVLNMGCGSSQQVAPQENVGRFNGDVKRESPPPRQNEPQNQPHVEEIIQESPKEKRKDSAKSKSSSSSSSSRSSSAKSTKSRPETAPGGNALPVTNEQPAKDNAQQPVPEQETQQSAEVVESNNNADSEKPADTSTEEPAKVEEAADETTTQGAAVVVSGEENNDQEQHEKPDFNEDVLKEFVEVENQVKSLEEKGAENNYQVKHARLLELHKNLTASQEKVEKLKAQTYVS